jgi:hypothetical protein
MSETPWSLVREIFDAAADVPTAERDALIRAMSHGDTGVVRAVNELLAADAPEISAAVSALTSHQQSVGAGVVLGSNVFNLAALLGLLLRGLRRLEQFGQRTLTHARAPTRH